MKPVLQPNLNRGPNRLPRMKNIRLEHRRHIHPNTPRLPPNNTRPKDHQDDAQHLLHNISFYSKRLRPAVKIRIPHSAFRIQIFAPPIPNLFSLLRGHSVLVES